jgi:hypothetical protein
MLYVAQFFDIFNSKFEVDSTLPNLVSLLIHIKINHVSLHISMFNLLMRTSVPNSRLAPDRQNGRSFY